ncbi:MAG TPA: transcriptional repressor AgaR [Steroidobacteraceae bacterium]
MSRNKTIRSTATRAAAPVRDTSSRRQRIGVMLQENGSVQVLELASMFGVSTQTIRKDLHYLEKRGVATRSYGGAISSQVVGIATETAVDAKRALHAQEKEKIGRRAAQMVQPGESIVLDSGTTTAQIARFLPDTDEITVVTNDFGVLAELAAKSRIQVVVLGGTLRRKNLAFYGAQTEAAIAELSVDKLFLGVDGLHAQKGITTHYEREAILNRMMVEVAQQVIAVTDSSKFGRMCLHKIVDLDELDMLITDSGADEAALEAIRKRDIEVIVV